MKFKQIILSLLAFVLIFNLVHAGGIYKIEKSVIANGGGTSSGGSYQVSGSIGQLDASNAHSSQTFTVQGGYWSQFSVNDVIFKNGFQN